MATRYPNGIETSDIECEGITADSVTVSGAITAASVTASTISGAVNRTALSVNATNDVALTAAQALAADITISAAGTNKSITLNMPAGRLITVTNGGENNVTLKNAAGDTGATATAAKVALFLTTATSVIKVTGDA